MSYFTPSFPAITPGVRHARHPADRFARRGPSRQVVLEALESRRLLATVSPCGCGTCLICGHGGRSGFPFQVNFQPETVETVGGYHVDAGRAYADQNGIQYGWVNSLTKAPANNYTARDRNDSRSPDQRYDTLLHLQRNGANVAWEVGLPNGTYRVTVVAGDPSYTDSVYKLNVEGTRVIDATPTGSNRWFEGSVVVNVADGRLTLSNASGSKNNKIAFLRVEQAVTPGGQSGTPTGTRSPFGNTPFMTPTTIQAEHFDRGGQNVAYFDADAQNRGAVFRTNEGVDLVGVPAYAGGGYAIGWTKAGEWVEYTLDVHKTATYDLQLRYSVGGPGGGVRFLFGGVDKTGTIPLTHTGGWNSYVSVTTPVTLTAGRQVVRLHVATAARSGQDVANLDWFKLTEKATAAPQPPAADPSTWADRWPSSFRRVADTGQQRFEAYNVAIDGKLYVLGGWTHWTGNNWLASNRSEVYDPKTNQWTRLKDIPVPHTHAGVAVDSRTRTVYFVAGERGDHKSQEFVAEVWTWHVPTDTYTKLPASLNLPQIRTGGAAAILHGKLHFFGGNPADRVTNVGDHWALDLSNTSAGWNRLSHLPSPRDHMSAVVLGGNIYAIGGEFGHDALHDQQKLVQSYDPATDRWTPRADLPTAKSHAEGATSVWNGRILMAGGQIDNQYSTDEVVLYDPVTDRWHTIGKLPARLQGTAVAIIDDFVIVSTGGLNRAASPQKATYIGKLR